MTIWTKETATAHLIALVRDPNVGPEYAMESANDWVADMENARAPRDQIDAWRYAPSRLADYLCDRGATTDWSPPV